MYRYSPERAEAGGMLPVRDIQELLGTNVCDRVQEEEREGKREAKREDDKREGKRDAERGRDPREGEREYRF